MKINKITIYVLGTLLSLGAVSCSDYLDLQPISDTPQEKAYARAADMEAALVGVYESWQSSDYYVWDNVLFQDVRTDNHYAGGDNPDIFAIDYNTINSLNPRVFSAWSTIYNAILKANLVLKYAPLCTDPLLTEERRVQIIGEAYFLRSYHYYNLVKMWGDVPLILEPITSTNPDDVRLPRTTADLVYAQIIADLTLALDMLPDTYGDASITKARATKGAVNALLAKAYAQKAQPEYDKVLEHANAVINSQAGYSLLSNFNDLFDGAHYNNAESILEVQFLGATEGNWAPQMHLPPSISGDTWRKFVTPSHDLVNAYDAEGDVIRRDATVLYESVTWVDEYWGNSSGFEIPFAYKWKNAMGWASTDRQYIFRLADIILLKAEALNELSRTAEAAVEVNSVRNRVELDDLPNGLDQAAMRTAILNERRLELAQEAQRWDDLRRFDVAVEIMNNLDEIDLRTGVRTDYAMDANDLLLPIPQQERNRNPNLTQNEGYE